MTKKKYEYYVLHKDLCANSFDEEAFLNKMGNDGWKLVGVVATTNGKPTLYFRRKFEERLPREIIFASVLQIIVDKIGCEETEVKDKAVFIDDLGCDSLDAVELLMEFEREFNIAIPDEIGEGVETVGDAVDLLYKLTNKK